MKPLKVLDTETTGTSPATDRILALCITEVNPETWETGKVEGWEFNPGIPIPPESTEHHGIRDADVKDLPSFKAMSGYVHRALSDCDLAGFCLIQFDVPILWEELYRAGIEWDLTGVHIVDAGTIFKKKEERTLTAAVRFYCGREHVTAHRAAGDVGATIDV
jgi:DNA polymerase-3 subunit epsilon